MQSVGFKEWAACDLVLVSGRGKELYEVHTKPGPLDGPIPKPQPQ